VITACRVRPACGRGSLAPRLQAFSLASFGYSEDEEERLVTREDAELAAGALVYAIDILLEELFQDVMTLGKEDERR
jgi:hypothetical protein